MRSKKIHFENHQGNKMAAVLEFPADRHPHNFVLFAHCFICGKNLQAARQLSRALSLRGFAVMRFDFTGLGEREGDLAGTRFSPNIEDLVRAAEYLAENYQAPSLLVGHSLGGAAVLGAAGELPSVKAVVTLASPFAPEPVSHLQADDAATIERKGQATVAIQGRKFTVGKQFLEDIRQVKLEEQLAGLGKALLIMHSPQDRIVSIDNAARMYQAARHPKSFISLDGGDHLLSDRSLAAYAGDTIASWALRYVDPQPRDKLKGRKEVVVRLGDEGYTTEIMARHHSLKADEPEDVGGNDFGPTPYELLSASLGACTAMTLHMYARRKKWDLQEVTVHLTHFKDYAKDAMGCEDKSSKIDYFERLLELEGDLSDQQKDRLMDIADKCPVHRTLHGDIEIKTGLLDQDDPA